MKKIIGWILVVLCIAWIILLASGGKDSEANKIALLGQGIVPVLAGIVGLYLAGVLKKVQ